MTRDEGRKYWIALPADKVEDLRAMLCRAANMFDQRAIRPSAVKRRSTPWPRPFGRAAGSGPA